MWPQATAFSENSHCPPAAYRLALWWAPYDPDALAWPDHNAAYQKALQEFRIVRDVNQSAMLGPGPSTCTHSSRGAAIPITCEQQSSKTPTGERGRGRKRRRRRGKRRRGEGEEGRRGERSQKQRQKTT